jgi:Castor and Pollux, part of voltage-gated ion channel
MQDEFYLREWPSLAGRRFAEVLLMFEAAMPVGVRPLATGEVLLNPADDYVLALGKHRQMALAGPNVRLLHCWSKSIKSVTALMGVNSTHAAKRSVTTMCCTFHTVWTLKQSLNWSNIGPAACAGDELLVLAEDDDTYTAAAQPAPAKPGTCPAWCSSAKPERLLFVGWCVRCHWT